MSPFVQPATFARLNKRGGFNKPTTAAETTMINDTIWDAKGDLAVATGADASARLAASTNAQFQLAKDSTTSTGLAWVSPYQLFTVATGAISETIPRHVVDLEPSANEGSGTLLLAGIYLPNNVTITSITFVSDSTAATSPVNQWFALYNSALDLLGQTDDDGVIAWGAWTAKTLNLASPYTTTSAGLYYLGAMVKATTSNGFACHTAGSITSFLSAKTSPILSGSSTSGLTGAAPDPANAISATRDYFYAYCS